MRFATHFQGVRRRALLALVVVAMMLALLPTAAFAAGGDNEGWRPNRNPGPQYNQQWNNNNQRWNGQPQHNNQWQHNDGWNKHEVGKHANYCSSTYCVRRGDTLSEIARHFHVSVRELANANGIRNPNRIYAGQTLCIP